MCDSIERDAQLLANRIALLRQEEQKTWKKIDDTKKRTNEILTLKKRNEDRIQKVSSAKVESLMLFSLSLAENIRLPGAERELEDRRPEQLLYQQAEAGREAEGAGGDLLVEAGRGEAVEDYQGAERPEEEVPALQGRAGEPHEEPDRSLAEASGPDENRGGPQPSHSRGSKGQRKQGIERGIHAAAERGRGDADGETRDGVDQEAAEHVGGAKGGVPGVGAGPKRAFADGCALRRQSRHVLADVSDEASS